MIWTREEFARFKPLHHVIVRVEELYRDQYGRIHLIDNENTRKENATHKGIVTKHPVYRDANPSNAMFDSEYEIEIGDIVYFGWEVLQIQKSPSNAHLLIEVEEEIYIAIAYRELIAGERGDEKFGLNGWVAGYHPKRTGGSTKIITFGNEEEAAIELLKTTSVFYKNNVPLTSTHQSDDDLERIIVSYAPKSYPTWNRFDEVFETTEVKAGDCVCFPESFALPLSNKLQDGHELVAVNVMQIAAFDDKHQTT